MKIGISGASGQLGIATVKDLKARLAADHIVGISRTPEKVEALGVAARFGDFDDPKSLLEAFAGLDRLLIIPSPDLAPGARAAQSSAAIHRAVEAGVEHVMFTSTLGARAVDKTHLWDGYFTAEQTLMRAAKKWTILRAAYYAESLIQQVRMDVAGGVHASIAPTPVNFIARDDLAAAAAGVLATEGHHGVIYQATGPASLSGEERAASIAKALGKPYGFAQISLAQYREKLKGAGLPAPVIDARASIQEMWASGGLDVVTRDVERLAGRRPRSLAEVMGAAFS